MGSIYGSSGFRPGLIPMPVPLFGHHTHRRNPTGHILCHQFAPATQQPSRMLRAPESFGSLITIRALPAPAPHSPSEHFLPPPSEQSFAYNIRSPHSQRPLCEAQFMKYLCIACAGFGAKWLGDNYSKPALRSTCLWGARVAEPSPSPPLPSPPSLPAPPGGWKPPQRPPSPSPPPGIPDHSPDPPSPSPPSPPPPPGRRDEQDRGKGVL